MRLAEAQVVAQSMSGMQQVQLLDLPYELLMIVAEWCHLQPRQQVTVEYASDPRRPRLDVGGGLDRLSRVNKGLRRITMPTMFSRLKMRCEEMQLHIHLATLVANKDILQAAR